MSLTSHPAVPETAGRSRAAVLRRYALPALVVVGVVVWVLLLAAAASVAQRVWRGEPYPTASPEVTRRVVQEHARHVHDVLALPGEAPREAGVERGDTDCYTRGLRYVTNFDTPEPGVYTMAHHWQTGPVTEDRARAAVGRLRATLAAEGWRVDTDSDRRTPGGYEERRVVLGDRGVDWAVIVWWDNRVEAVSVRVVSPCTRLPDGS